MVTVARLTPGPPEPEGCRGAAVTLPAHHQGLTVAVPVVFVAEDGGAARVVTPTRSLPGALKNNSQETLYTVIVQPSNITWKVRKEME